MLIQSDTSGFQHAVASEITPESVYQTRRDLIRTLATGSAAGATSGPALDHSARAGEARPTERTTAAATGREANRMEDMAPG